MKRQPEAMYVTRVEGRRVIDPHSGRDLPAPGVVVRVTREQFWFRRLADGDVVEVPAPAAEISPVPAAAEKPPRKKPGTEE